jgi:hypothetical protein
MSDHAGLHQSGRAHHGIESQAEGGVEAAGMRGSEPHCPMRIRAMLKAKASALEMEGRGPAYGGPAMRTSRVYMPSEGGARERDGAG